MGPVREALAATAGEPMPLASFDLTPAQVRERFRWASLQGEPRWLWPDVEISDWQRALASISTATRDVMLTGQSEVRFNGPAQAFGIACFTSGMGPLLGHWLESKRLSGDRAAAALLELHLRHNRLRMSLMAERAAAAGEAMARHGVRAAVTKGMHTAYEYFPEPGARPLADIDLLIAPAEKARARQALLSCGLEPGLERTWPFEQTWRPAAGPNEPCSLSLVHASDPWTLDLHTSLNRRYAAGSPPIRLDAAIRGTTLTQSSLTPALRTLPQPALLLNLAVHCGCGLNNLTLLRLIELAFVIRKDTENGSWSWPAFMAAAERAKASSLIYVPLRLCEDLVPRTVPSGVLRWARKDVPHAVLAVTDPLTPVTAHMMVRCSLAERFMWAPSWWAVLRQVMDEAFPPGCASLATLASIYRTRVMRLTRRTLTR